MTTTDRTAWLAERKKGIGMGACGNYYDVRNAEGVIFLDTKTGQVEAFVDLSDLTMVLDAPYKWSAAYDKRHKTWYAQFITARPNRRTISMHRYITDAPVGLEVDHLDHDGLNNRRASNLRIVTTSRNQLNRKGASSRSTTGILGVDFNKQTGKFRAIIRVNGKSICLGYFVDKDMAANALRAFRAERGIECQL